MWNVGRINAVCAVLCEQHACGTPMPVPRTAPRLSHEQFYHASSFCCCLVNLCQIDFLSNCIIRAACISSSHVVHVAAPRVHDPLELCHVIGVKIWVNICPPSFLIVRPMRKLLRPVPSAVLSIRTFSSLKNGILWNINCRRTDLTCQVITFCDYTNPQATVHFSDRINERNFHLFEHPFCLIVRAVRILSQELEETSFSSFKKPSLFFIFIR